MPQKTITCPSCNEIILLEKRKKELEAIPATKRNLHTLITSIYDIQHMRILFENRFTATGELSYGKYAEKLLTLEGLMKDDAESITKQYPIHEWIISQKGLSYDLAGQLIGIIQDIGKFSNISKLWAYFGLGVVDICQDCGKLHYQLTQKAEKITHITDRLKEQNDKKIVKESVDLTAKARDMICNCEHPHTKKERQHMIKGVLLDYNPTAKMLAYKVGSQFVKQGDFYRTLYDQFYKTYSERDDLKQEIDSKKGKKVKGKDGVVETKGTARIHAMAQRKMVKIFLSHLWEQWRKMEGLPVTKPYAIAVLGHGDYIEAPQ